MLYLMFVRLACWMALLARSSASKDAELLAPRRVLQFGLLYGLIGADRRPCQYHMLRRINCGMRPALTSENA